MAGHRPVWHALAMLVPIYNLFRIHKHIAVIKELSGSPTLSPRLVVALTIGITALGLASLGIDNAAILFVIALTGLAVTAFIVGWAQSALNQYWRARMGQGCRTRPLERANWRWSRWGFFCGSCSYCSCLPRRDSHCRRRG